MNNPYIISAELDLPNTDLRQIIKPSAVEGFREDLDADLRAMGKNTLWVPSGTIQNGLEQAVAQTTLPVVSLDDRYVSSADQYLGISRGVDPVLRDDGYVARRGYPAIEQQIKKIPALGSEIVLVDDVLFSGEMVSWLAGMLKPYGVKIGAAVVGIAIREGIDKLAAEGIEVSALRVFDSVDDELCERDFAVVPGSGRRINATGSNALYFDAQNGKPDTWASIPPQSTASFCANSLKRSIALLQPGVPMKALGRYLGYGTGGTGITQLTNRLGELL